MLAIVNKTINENEEIPKNFGFSKIKIKGGQFGDSGSSGSSTTEIIVPNNNYTPKPSFAICKLSQTASIDSSNNRGSMQYQTINSSTGFSQSYGFVDLYGTRDVTFDGYTIVPIEIDNDTTITLNSVFKDTTNGYGADFELVAGITSIKKEDYSTNVDNIKIRYKKDSEDDVQTICANPEVDFDTYGTEFTDTEYQTTSVLDSNYVDISTTGSDTTNYRVSSIIKMQNVDMLANIIIPITNVTTGTNYDTTSNSYSLTIYLWNFRTKTWISANSLFGGSETSSNYVFGPISNSETFKVMISNVNYPFINYKKSDFVKNGAMYIGLETAKGFNVSDYNSFTMRFNYIGTGYINNIWC